MRTLGGSHQERGHYDVGCRISQLIGEALQPSSESRSAGKPVRESAHLLADRLGTDRRSGDQRLCETRGPGEGVPEHLGPRCDRLDSLDDLARLSSPEAAKAFPVPRKTYPVPSRVKDAAGEAAVLFPTFSPLGHIPDPALWDERALVDLIDGARRSLSLQFLSYSPLERQGGRYAAIDDALRRAGKRGVQVRLIVADWEKGSPAVAALKELAALPNVEVAFTAIPEWSGGYIPFARVEHCKYVVADGEKFWLGTANCEKSYFYAARNLGIVGTSPNLAGVLARIFLKSWNSPYKELITRSGEYAPREHGERNRTP